MGDKIILTFLSILFLSSLTSAIVINEFTVDPQTDWDLSSTTGASDEWIELYNPSDQPVDLTNWSLFLQDTGNDTETLSGTISAFGYKTILDPTGSQNNDGQILLYNNLGSLVDSVSYGNFNDTNISDNAPDGNANSLDDECLARIPNGADTNQDSNDFNKTSCTYNKENKILNSNEQGLEATILGKIVLSILPRYLDFGPIRSPSTNNPALNAPIMLNATGSEEEIRIEIIEVIGNPFDVGLKIDGLPANGANWSLPINNQYVEAVPTLDVPSGLPPGPVQGTIVYSITGPTP